MIHINSLINGTKMWREMDWPQLGFRVLDAGARVCLLIFPWGPIFLEFILFIYLFFNVCLQFEFCWLPTSSKL